MHCPTCLDYSNSEQKRRKPVEIKQAKQPLAFYSVFVDGDIYWIPVGRTMNRLQSSARKNAVEVLTEDLLWAKGLLGGRNTEDAMGHCSFLQWSSLCTTQWGTLHTSPSQVEVVEKPGERPYLLYHEDRDTSRNHPIGYRDAKLCLRLLFATLAHNPRDASSLFALTIQWTTHSTCNHRFDAFSN